MELSDTTAQLRFSYMPYKTGAYAAAPPGSHLVPDLRAAVVMANSLNGTGQTSLSIAITDPGIAPDDLKRALMQAGCGLYIYMLSADATQILASPTPQLTWENADALLADSYALGCFMLTEEELSALGSHTWDAEFMQKLTNR